MNAFFTPSVESPKTLLAILVKRHDLLKELVSNYTNALNKSQSLKTMIYGPRGFGKTHLITLVNDQLKSSVNPNCLIIWFKEEEWDISSYATFLIRLLQLLNDKYKLNIENNIQHQREILAKNKSKDSLKPSIAKTEKLFFDTVRNRPIVILAENFDLILANFGKEGIRGFRTLVNKTSSLSLLCASSVLLNQSHFGGTVLNNFFDKFYELNKFNLDDAKALFQKKSDDDKNKNIKKFIHSKTFIQKLRTIHALAGGNPRLYTVLYNLLSNLEDKILIRDSSICKTIINSFDALTPYYQQFMYDLSPLHRMILNFISSSTGSVTQKEIYTHCLTSQNSISAQLAVLKKRGLIKSTKIGREVLYDVSELLMSFTLNLKNNDDTIVEPLVEFLQLWFSESELETQFENNDLNEYDIIREQLDSALVKLNSTDSTIDDTHLFKKYQDSCNHRNYQEALKLADQMITNDDTSPIFWTRKAYCYLMLNAFDRAKKALDKSVSLNSTISSTYRLFGDYYAELGEYKMAELKYKEAYTRNKHDIDCLTNLSVVLQAQEKYEEAKKICYKRLKIDAIDNWELINKAITQCNLKHWHAALETLDSAISKGENTSVVFHYKAKAQRKIGNYIESIVNYNKALLRDNENPRIWKYRYLPLSKLGLHNESLTTCNHALTLYENNIEKTFPLRTDNYAIEGAWRNHNIGSRIIERQANPVIKEVHLWKAISHYMLNEVDASLDSLNTALMVDSDYTIALANKPIALMSAGRYDESYEIYKKFSLDKQLDSFFVSSNFSLLCYLMGNHTEGNKILLQALSKLNKPITKGNMQIIFNLFYSTKNQEIWEDVITIWVKYFSESNSLSALVAGLPYHINTLSPQHIEVTDVIRWSDTWNKITGTLKIFDIPLILLKTASEIKESSDRTPLYALPEPERILLESLTYGFCPEQLSKTGGTIADTLRDIEESIPEDVNMII